MRPPSPSGSALEECFHDPITARRASTLPPPQRLSSMPPHPVLMALEAQRRPSMRPGSSPSIAPSRPSSAPSFDFTLEHEAPTVALPTVVGIPWTKVAVAALAIPALFAVASWFYYV